jgi:predicted transcriptional regulator
VSRTVVIRVGTVQQVRRELGLSLAAIERGEPVRRTREIWFATLDQVAALLTGPRLELLRLVHQERPRSVAHLVRLAKRGAPAIEEDLQLLATAGLLKIVTKGRAKRPVAGYDRIHLAGDITIGRAAA